MKPVTMRMVVDLPAPFGPRKPSTSPRSTAKETPSTARFAPKLFTRFSIRIMDKNSEGRDYRLTPAQIQRPPPEEKIMRMLIGSLAGLLFSLSAMAQPSLKMMIPANPGGGWDQTGRSLAAAMQSAKLVSGVQFDNKGGAAGTIGLAQFVNSSKGDPNAVMIGGLVMVGGIILGKSPVNLSQVTPVARLVSEWEVIVVPAQSPIKT